MAATISLKDHLAQLGELEWQKNDLSERVEAFTQELQEATEKASQLSGELDAEKQAHADTTSKLESLRDQLSEAQEAHAEEIQKWEADFEQAVKEGVIDRLAEQGREPVDLSAAQAPKPRELSDQEVQQLSPTERAQFFQDVRAGKAILI